MRAGNVSPGVFEKLLNCTQSRKTHLFKVRIENKVFAEKVENTNK